MTTVTIADEYAEILSAFGNVQHLLESALQRCTIEQVTAKINELRARDAAYQTKYGMAYSEFAARTAADETFVADIERNIEKVWENDLADWEFCNKGAQDWTKKLQQVLLSRSAWRRPISSKLRPRRTARLRGRCCGYRRPTAHAG